MLTRAIAFYRDELGFNLDHDTRAGDQRFAQLTAPGSGCSIVQQIKARADNTLIPR